MTDNPSRTHPNDSIRLVLVLLVWALWLISIGLWELARGLLGILRSRKVRRLVWAVSGCCVAVGCIQLAPLIYGRFALCHSAQTLARSSYGLSDDEIRRSLVRTAMEYGYTTVGQHGDAFNIENYSQEDGTPMCAIEIELKQPVHLWHVYPYVFRVKTRVVQPVTLVDFRKKRQDGREMVE